MRLGGSFLLKTTRQNLEIRNSATRGAGGLKILAVDIQKGNRGWCLGIQN